MVSPVALLYAGVFGVAGAYVVYEAIDGIRPAYRILREEPIPVRDLERRSGTVEVAGTAEVDDDHGTVRSPFTDTECLVYEYEAQELQSSGQHSSWKTLDDGGRAVPFLLTDETGTVQVDPAGADLHLEAHEHRVSGGDEPPERIARYIAETEDVDEQTRSVDLIVTEFDYGRDQKFVERRLDVGEEVHVYGPVDRAPDHEWGSVLVDAIIEHDRSGSAFVVSDTSERWVAWHVGKSWLLAALIGVALVGVAVFYVVSSVAF